MATSLLDGWAHDFGTASAMHPLCPLISHLDAALKKFGSRRGRARGGVADQRPPRLKQKSSGQEVRSIGSRSQARESSGCL